MSLRSANVPAVRRNRKQQRGARNLRIGCLRQLRERDLREHRPRVEAPRHRTSDDRCGASCCSRIRCDSSVPRRNGRRESDLHPARLRSRRRSHTLLPTDRHRSHLGRNEPSPSDPAPTAPAGDSGAGRRQGRPPAGRGRTGCGRGTESRDTARRDRGSGRRRLRGEAGSPRNGARRGRTTAAGKHAGSDGASVEDEDSMPASPPDTKCVQVAEVARLGSVLTARPRTLVCASVTE